MKIPSSLQRISVITVIVACAAFVTVGVWRASAVQPDEENIQQLSEQKRDFEQKAKENLNKRALAGIGQLHFAGAKSSSREIKNSVNETVDFLLKRSEMYAIAKNRRNLVQAEKMAFSESHHQSVPDFVDTLTDVIRQHLENLTDEEIEKTAQTFSKNGLTTLTADGRYGFYSPEEFAERLRFGRSLCQSASFQEALRSNVAEEVDSRLNFLTSASPQQFEHTKERGLTLAQAVLLTYSITTGDPLIDSPTDMAAQVSLLNDIAIAHGRKDSIRPVKASSLYGHNGYFQSPLAVLFTSETVQLVIDRAKGGKKK